MNTKCIFCNASIDSSALYCKECDRKQSKVNYIIEKWSIKGLLTLIIVPFILWYIPTQYAERKQEIDTIEQANKDILGLISKLEATFTLAYEPCMGASKDECIKQVETINKTFLENTYSLQSKISLYYPELVATVKLLESMNLTLSRELLDFWSDYTQCIQNKQLDWMMCKEDKRKRPLQNIQISKFILEYLSHKVQKIVSLKTGKVLSKYSDDIIKIREIPCLILPKKELSSFNGWRKEVKLNGKNRLEFLDFRPIYHIIWQEYLVPGSRLNVDTGYENMKALDDNNAIIEILNKTK